MEFNLICEYIVYSNSSIIVDDGTGVAMVTSNNQMVQQLLHLSNGEWRDLHDCMMGRGEVLVYQVGHIISIYC